MSVWFNVDLKALNTKFTLKINLGQTINAFKKKFNEIL